MSARSTGGRGVHVCFGLADLSRMEREELGGDESGDEDEDVATATTGGRHQFHAGARGPGEDDKDGCSSDEDEEGAGK